MIPILMSVFALGGSTFGMAEESLAFYALIITVMIAAGYDALVGASMLLLGCGIGVLGSTINPFATGIASGFAGVSIERRHRRPADHPRRRDDRRDRLRDALCGEGEGRSEPIARLRPEGRERGPLPDRDGRVGVSGHPDGPSEGRARPVHPRVRRDDLRRHPVGGPRRRAAHPVVVVPRDDRLVPVVLDPHRGRRPDARGGLHDRRSSTAHATCSASRSSSGSLVGSRSS